MWWWVLCGKSEFVWCTMDGDEKETPLCWGYGAINTIQGKIFAFSAGFFRDQLAPQLPAWLWLVPIPQAHNPSLPIGPLSRVFPDVSAATCTQTSDGRFAC